MVIDAVTEHLFDKPYDRDGRIAACGQADRTRVERSAARSVLPAKPPKTAGREAVRARVRATHFSALWPRADENDIVATATALTARSIANAIRNFAPR